MSAEDRPVVVGVDGSEHGAPALQWAADHARDRGWPLWIVHAVDDALAPYFEPGVVEEAARQIVDDARTAVAGRVPRVETQVVVGKPSAVLLEAARDARLVVVGRRGRGVFGSLLLGSVSFTVASRSRVPVVVVPERVEDDPGKPVVVGVDGSPQCLTALEYGFDFADRSGRPLHAIHVWEVADLYGWEYGPGHRERLARLEEAAERTISETLAGWREKYPQVEVHEQPVRGHPVGRLADSSRAAALLVIGGRGHSVLRDILLGSVARGVLQHAHCPVAVVHSEEPAGG